MTTHERRGGPNGNLSLAEAKQNFVALGACSPETARFVRKPTLHELNPEIPLPGEPFKLGDVRSGEEIEFRHNNRWKRELTSGGGERIWIAPSGRQVALIERLTEALPEPFCVLFVHVVPRSVGQASRFQSPFLGREEFSRFIARFRRLMEKDGRADYWIASFTHGGDLHAQLIYDRHQYLYAYGPLEEFEEVLNLHGLSEGEISSLPGPHSHHYHAAFDADVADLLQYWKWEFSPLHEADE